MYHYKNRPVKNINGGYKLSLAQGVLCVVLCVILHRPLFTLSYLSPTPPLPICHAGDKRQETLAEVEKKTIIERY